MNKLFIAAFTMLLSQQCFASNWVVVAASNSGFQKMNADAVERVFLAKTLSLPGVDKIKLIDLPDGNAVRDDFYNVVSKKNAVQVKSYWARLVFTGKGEAPTVAQNDAEVKKMLQANAAAIGYIDKGSVDASVKVVFAPE